MLYEYSMKVIRQGRIQIYANVRKMYDASTEHCMRLFLQVNVFYTRKAMHVESTWSYQHM